MATAHSTSISAFENRPETPIPGLARPVAPGSLDGQALADSPQGVAINGTGGRQGLGDRLAHMRQLYRTAGQKHRINCLRLQTGLIKANHDPRADTVGKRLSMADEFLA